MQTALIWLVATQQRLSMCCAAGHTCFLFRVLCVFLGFALLCFLSVCLFGDWFLYVFFGLLFTWDRDLLCSLSWPQTHKVAQADAELTILLSQPPECWDYWCVPSSPDGAFLFELWVIPLTCLLAIFQKESVPPLGGMLYCVFKIRRQGSQPAAGERTWRLGEGGDIFAHLLGRHMLLWSLWDKQEVQAWVVIPLVGVVSQVDKYWHGDECWLLADGLKVTWHQVTGQNFLEAS